MPPKSLGFARDMSYGFPFGIPSVTFGDHVLPLTGTMSRWRRNGKRKEEIATLAEERLARNDRGDWGGKNSTGEALADAGGNMDRMILNNPRWKL